MAEAKKKIASVFENLSKVDVGAYAEKKGMFTYLSWAWAVNELLSRYPTASWEVHKWGVDGCRQPYMQTKAGCFVQVTVTVEGVERTQVHPVLDNRNNTIKEPNAFDVNTAIMRCLTKAISLHGLGLYIYAGEDLPQDLSTDSAKPVQKAIPKKVANGTVITGHKPNMKTGGHKSTASQQNYIMKLREDFMKKLGNEKGLQALTKIEKDVKLESLNVAELTKQQASDYIESLVQTYAIVGK
tara:strand:- start:240 stop:962 length:723 start_codon:yes stop_codon:yes gene_type:complete